MEYLAEPSGARLFRLMESLGIGNLQFTEFSGEVIHEFAQLPQLADEFVKAGIQHICLWHRAGGLYQMNGATKEIMDEPETVLQELEKALADVKESGINMSIILNLRLLKVIFDPYREIGESEAIRSKDGSPASREAYPGSPYHLNNLGPSYNLGDSVTLCQRPESPFAERARTLVEKMLNLGFTSIFIDQPLNSQCCFAPQHAHSAPDLAHHDCVRWMGDVSRLVKARSEEGYVIGELPELFQTQKIDLWWYWQWKYLSPEVYRYSHPDSLQLWVVDGDVGELNRAFAMGFYANLTPAGMERGMSGRPAVAAQAAALAKLREATAAWTVETRFVDREGLECESAPGIVAYAFAGHGRAAVIMAETAGVAGEARLTFEPARHGTTANEAGVLLRQTGVEEPTTPPENGRHTLKIELAPFDVAVWRFA